MLQRWRFDPERAAVGKPNFMSAEKGESKEITVPGIAASQGIAYGQIFVYLQSEVEVPNYQVDPGKRIEEISRFEKALLVTRQQIAKIQSEVEKNLGKEEALIFDAQGSGVIRMAKMSGPNGAGAQSGLPADHAAPLTGDLVSFFENCGVMKAVVDGMARAVH